MDFDLLRNALREAHGGLYRFSDSTTLNRRFEEYRKQLPSVTSQFTFISLLSAMLAQVNDGHLRLDYDATTTKQLSQAQLFPFQVMLEGEKLMVTWNDTPANETIIPGMEILSINGRKTPEILGVILARISGDGYIQTGKRKRLERLFSQSYWLFVDQLPEFTLVVRNTAGKEMSVTVAGVLTGQRATNRS